MTNKQRISHAFVVRIWREQSRTHPNDQTRWRGRVQHAFSDEYLVFESLDELMSFIQGYTDKLTADVTSGSRRLT